MKLKIFKSFGIMAAVCLLFVLPMVSFGAVGATGACDGRICNPLGDNVTDITSFIKVLLRGVLKIGIPIIALAIIYSGFLFVAARGNPEKISGAKDALLYTIIGSAILLGAWALAQLISSTVFSLS